MSAEKEVIAPKSNRGKIKAFIIGALATLGIGATYTVKVMEKEQQAKDWKALNADADSIHIGNGEFYAEKNLSDKDKQTLEKLQAEKAKILEKLQKRAEKPSVQDKKQIEKVNKEIDAIAGKEYKAFVSTSKKGKIYVENSNFKREETNAMWSDYASISLATHTSIKNEEKDLEVPTAFDTKFDKLQKFRDKNIER